MGSVGRAAAGLQAHCVASVEKMSAVRVCNSAAECCSLRSRLGLAGSGLGRRSRRGEGKKLSLSSSSSKPTKGGRLSHTCGATPAVASSAASTPVALFLEDSLFPKIDAQALEAETPVLIAHCADMDWKLLAEELRSQALNSLQSTGSGALCLKALEKEMNSWVHDSMIEGIETPIKGAMIEDGWSYESAVQELRMQANLQAVQRLAKAVDSSFEWEVAAAELHQRVFVTGAAEVPEALNPEQRLLHTWFQSQGDVADEAHRLAQEALASTSATAHVEIQDWQHLVREEETSAAKNAGGAASDATSSSQARDKSWFGLGAALAASLGVQGSSVMDAYGMETAINLQPNPESAEAASRAPSWLAPAVLAFPVVSYFAFSFYRERVNPYAKVTDWMFSVVALVIVANIVLMATLGVRLY